jgi:hypothetical protein
MPKNQKTMSSHSSSDKEISKCIELMFSKFAAWYGHIWRSQFKEDGFLRFAKKEWQEGLGRFNEAIVNQALLHCREHYELPPTLPQIIQCCRQIKQETTFYVAKNDYVPPHPSIVESHLQRCKSFLTK